MNLWSSDPHERVDSARKLSKKEQVEIVKALVNSSPMKPWLFGMPTSINPYILTIGPSPGSSPDKTDTVLNTRSYAAPTCGKPHEKIYYEDTKGFWRKVRSLYEGMIRKQDEDLSKEDCLSVSGNLNFGVGLAGEATVGHIERKFAEWIPVVTTKWLKPKLIILLGLKTILGNSEVNRWIASSGHWKLNFNKPEKMIRFDAYAKKGLFYRVWKYEHGKIVMWPQHPSRPPFSNSNNIQIWRSSVQEAAEKIL